MYVDFTKRWQFHMSYTCDVILPKKETMSNIYSYMMSYTQTKPSDTNTNLYIY